VGEVRFPLLSQERPDAEGVLTTWFVADQAVVAPEQLLAEVAVDKVSAEVSAPEGGMVHLLVPEEATVRQGAAIARIDT
jgi:pyruvate/2-oxoglutarate dehydrogenase complex dihydrolipoamide acyltransferase (E2) component